MITNHSPKRLFCGFGKESIGLCLHQRAVENQAR